MFNVILSSMKDQIGSTQILAVTEAPALVIEALLKHSWKVANSTKFCHGIFKNQQLGCDKFPWSFPETIFVAVSELGNIS